MAFRTRRQRRYAKLLRFGFTRLEAQKLSGVAFAVPYMADLIRLRKQQIREWRKAGVTTRAEFYRRIAEFYVQKGFYKRIKSGLFKGSIRVDPWALLRFVQEQFAAKYPSYTSPSQRKRRRDFIEFRGR